MEAILPLIALPVVAAVIFAFGLGSGLSGGKAQVLAGGLVLGAVCLIPLLMQRALPIEKRHTLVSLWSLTYFVYFAMPPFTQYLWWSVPSETRTHLINIETGDILTGQFVALLGILFMLGGYMLPVGQIISASLPRPKVEWPHHTAMAVAIIMIPLGWAVFLAGQFGLIPARAGSGVLGAIASSIYFGISLLTVILLRHKSHAALLALLLIIPPMMAFSFFTGVKRLFLSPLIMIALTYIVMERKIRASWLIGGFLVIVFLYPAAQFYRENVQGALRRRSVDVLSEPGEAIGLVSGFVSGVDFGEYVKSGIQATGLRLDLLGIVSVIVRDTPDRVPYQGGWTIGNIFISFIPRVFWPGKPDITFGRWVTQNYIGPSMSSTGSSWVGELFFNFGYAGVIFGMLIVGIYFRMLHTTFFGWGAPIPAVLAAVVILWTTCPAIEMNLIAPFSGLWFALFPIFLAQMAVRTLAPPAQPRPVPVQTRWTLPPGDSN